MPEDAAEHKIRKTPKQAERHDEPKEQAKSGNGMSNQAQRQPGKTREEQISKRTAQVKDIPAPVAEPLRFNKPSRCQDSRASASQEKANSVS